MSFAFLFHWFMKARKVLNFLCPTDGKTTNGLKSFFAKIFSMTIRFIRWSFFNPMEFF